MAEASNTHKERVRLLLWVLENLGKAPEDEWAAYEREMDEAAGGGAVGSRQRSTGVGLHGELGVWTVIWQ